MDLYGYAIAGGGRGIERVDISITNGKSWLEALRLPKLQIDDVKDDPHLPQWTWTLWQLKFVEVETPCIVIVKAVCNTKPFTFRISEILVCKEFTYIVELLYLFDNNTFHSIT